MLFCSKILCISYSYVSPYTDVLQSIWYNKPNKNLVYYEEYVKNKNLYKVVQNSISKKQICIINL